MMLRVRFADVVQIADFPKSPNNRCIHFEIPFMMTLDMTGTGVRVWSLEARRLRLASLFLYCAGLTIASSPMHDAASR
jgi:hypothetical protein